MRFKEDVRDDVGADLADRMLVPLAQTTVDASPDEEAIYAILAAMRSEATKKNSDEAWRHHALLQYGIYKQFLSSPESCRKTVQKRMKSVLEKRAGQPRTALPGTDRRPAGQSEYPEVFPIRAAEAATEGHRLGRFPVQSPGADVHRVPRDPGRLGRGAGQGFQAEVHADSSRNSRTRCWRRSTVPVPTCI